MVKWVPSITGLYLHIQKKKKTGPSGCLPSEESTVWREISVGLNIRRSIIIIKKFVGEIFRGLHNTKPHPLK